MKASDLDNMADPPKTDIFGSLTSYNDSVVKSLSTTLKAQSRSQNPARWAYERLTEYIKDFEAKLDDDHEIGARLVSFGQSVTFHIEDMGYYGPDIITFYGSTDDMERVQLIQHISQLSVLLVTVKKQQPKARRIGFILDKKEAESNP